MTKASVPNRPRSYTGDESLVLWCDRCSRDGVEVARAIAVNDLASGLEVLNRKPRGSNSIETALSQVNWSTERRF
jgi:hypothetical protein